MKETGLIPKKSLGQNFLISDTVSEKIVSAAEITNIDTILEIGPGTGFLTEKLIRGAKKTIAIEKDRRAVEFLKNKFKENNLFVLNDDILEVDFEKLGLLNQQFIVVGNIPYYITGQILRKIFSGKIVPKRAVLMVQKEVAERITTRDGKESLLSISVKAYGNPKIVSPVKRGNFRPIPKVDSAILLINSISKDFFKDISETNFFEILRAGFAHKRKQLAGNLEKRYPKIKEAMALCEIERKVRPEELSPENWACLTKKTNFS